MNQDTRAGSASKVAWWVVTGALLVVGGVALLAGLVFGTGTGGIEPDGLFVRCGPGWLGRNDSEWDARCLPAMNHDRTISIVAFSVALIVLAVAAGRFWKRRRSALRTGPSSRRH